MLLLFDLQAFTMCRKCSFGYCECMLKLSSIDFDESSILQCLDMSSRFDSYSLMHTMHNVKS